MNIAPRLRRHARLAFLYALALLGRLFARRSAASPRSILYIKPDHLGDLLLATPALAALRDAAPSARISALVGPWARVVLARNPNIDVLLTCPFPGFERGAAERQPFGLLRPYARLLRYALLLRAGRYDVALIGRDDHWWGAALSLLAGIPLRFGFNTPECRPFLTTALPWRPNEHVTRQGLALVEALRGSEATNAAPAARNPQARFDPAPEDIAWAAAWAAEQGLGPSEQLVVIHPGTGGPAKLWPEERWAEVGDWLVKQPGLRLALTGGPGEEALVERVAALMRRRPIVAAGRTTVGQLAALLGRSALVLGVDSGPLHLAAAIGRPTIHLYGPGDDSRFGPWGPTGRHLVLRERLWCSPCGVFSHCPRGLAQPECMALLASADVQETARRQLQLP